MGLIYYKGETGKINLAASLEYFRRAMVNGNDDAIFMLGEMYYNGYEVDKDYTEAMDYYVEYERLTHSSDAQYMIGKMYYEGEGVKKDVATAKKWFKMAAEQGNEDAVSILEEIDHKDLNKTTDVAFKIEPVNTNKAEVKKGEQTAKVVNQAESKPVVKETVKAVEKDVDAAKNSLKEDSQKNAEDLNKTKEAAVSETKVQETKVKEDAKVTEEKAKEDVKTAEKKAKEEAKAQADKLKAEKAEQERIAKEEKAKAQEEAKAAEKKAKEEKAKAEAEAKAAEKKAKEEAKAQADK